MKCLVVGSGSWGTAMAHVFSNQNLETTIWGRDSETLTAIDQFKENKKYLRGYPLSPLLKVTSQLAEAIQSHDIIICGIPTQMIRSVFLPHARLLENKVLINLSKGIEKKSLNRVSDIFSSINPTIQYGVLSGPSFAEEVIQNLPTAVTLAFNNLELCQKIQKQISSQNFRVYSSKDVIGVEIAGALKNVIAIASGLVIGLNLGSNALATIITRGIAEVARLGEKMGAQIRTFQGLSGVGDFVLTCTGPLSRNRKVGYLLSQSKTLLEINQTMPGVAEGVFTTESAYQLSQKLKVEMPIVEAIHKILYEEGSISSSISFLMEKNIRSEWD